MMGTADTVEAFLAEWVAAFNSHDLDRHMALYMENAMLFGSVDELQAGRAAIRTYFGRRGPHVRVKSYPMPKVMMLGENTALTAGHVDFADGDQPMPYRMTWTLVKHKGQWRIAQHHGSPRKNA
jgi:uncharacterized protein (TIGR02246 family)